MTKQQKRVSGYLKYSGLAFQMLFILLIGWVIGSLIDRSMEWDDPYGAIALTLLFLIGFFYKLYVDLIKDP